MAAKKGSANEKAMKALTALTGVGAATATKMIAAGMKTPAGVRSKGVNGLVKAGISAAVAKKIISGLPKAVAKKTAAKAKTSAAAAKKKAAPKKKAPKNTISTPSLSEMLKRINR